MLKRFLIWASKRYSHRVTDWEGRSSFRRFCVLGYTDEWRDGNGKLHPSHRVHVPNWIMWVYRKTKRKLWLGRWTVLPSWAPCNIFVHWWNPANLEDESWHDHPRWSISIPLRGEITEITPWGETVMRPGMVILRSHRYIHKFKMKAEHRGKTWTMFIVGRRVHPQNIYRDIKRVETPK